MSWMVTVLGRFRAEAGLAYWTKRALRPWSEDETGAYPSFTSAISIFSRAATPSPSARSRKALGFNMPIILLNSKIISRSVSQVA